MGDGEAENGFFVDLLGWIRYSIRSFSCDDALRRRNYEKRDNAFGLSSTVGTFF